MTLGSFVALLNVFLFLIVSFLFMMPPYLKRLDVLLYCRLICEGTLGVHWTLFLTMLVISGKECPGYVLHSGSSLAFFVKAMLLKLDETSQSKNLTLSGLDDRDNYSSFPVRSLSMATVASISANAEVPVTKFVLFRSIVL